MRACLVWILIAFARGLGPEQRRTALTVAAMKRCLGGYDAYLIRRPLLTKMATGCVIEVIGDLVAQKCSSDDRWSCRRSAAVGLDGLLTGLVLHHVYGAQARWLPPSHLAWWVPFCHILVDEIIVDPSFVVGFIAITDCDWSRLVPTLKASKVVTITTLPAQWINFRYVPLRYRVIVVNMIDLVWSAVVSFTAHSK